ncbi:response regulator transcription factor [Azonexus sp.]|uniref:response regulator transcription factor n=1 Tax=Azonexus sp. TaxID=1872668 RepID=UPI0039E505FB
MSLLPDHLTRTIGFTLYVLWLVAFPMSGPLLEGSTAGLSHFLWPQVMGLLACTWCTPRVCITVLRISTLSTSLITLLWLPLLKFVPDTFLYAALGLVSAPLSIQAALLLKGCHHFIAAAATGLVAGNLGLLALDALPLDNAVKRALLAGILAGFLLAPPIARSVLHGATPYIYRYLPFIFLFQLLSGLMYGHLLPSYTADARWPGSELLFYIGGALLAIPLLRRRLEITLLTAVCCSLLAFSSQQTLPSPLAAHVSLYCMMLAAGLVDVFALAFALSFTNALRAYGLTAATLVAGIAAGHHLAVAFTPGNTTLNLLALITLNLAVFTLILQAGGGQTNPLRPPSSLPQGDAAPAEKTGADALPATAIFKQELPTSLSALLSEQECEVLASVLQHHPYKQIALRMNISESSVKTYVQRIYRKTGVFRRSQLLAMVHEASASHTPDRPG